MLKTILLILTLLLAACDNPHPDWGSDDYHFEPSAARIQPQPQIIVVTHPSVTALKTTYKATPGGRALTPYEHMFGFAVINSKTCTVHIVDPISRYDPTALGHEVTHCLYGNFHPGQDEARS